MDALLDFLSIAIYWVYKEVQNNSLVFSRHSLDSLVGGPQDGIDHT